MQKRTEPERLQYLYEQLQEELGTWFCKFWFEEDWEDYNNSTDLYWIGNGTVLGIGDIFVDMEDIMFCIKSGISRDIFSDAYWHTVENEIDHLRLNIRSYVEMRGPGTHEELLEHLEKKHLERQTAEYKAEIERQMKAIVDKYTLEIDNLK